MAFIDNLRDMSRVIPGEKDTVLLAFKKEIEGMAKAGYTNRIFSLHDFSSLVSEALNREINLREYLDLTNHAIISLRKEGFDISLQFYPDNSGFFITVKW